MKRGPYRRKQPSQPALPGTVSARNRGLEQKAQAYVAVSEQLAAVRQDKANATAALVAAMHKAGLTAYRGYGVSVQLVAKDETVKVLVARRPDRPDLGDDTEAAEALASVGVVVE